MSHSGDNISRIRAKITKSIGVTKAGVKYNLS